VDSTAVTWVEGTQAKDAPDKLPAAALAANSAGATTGTEGPLAEETFGGITMISIIIGESS
jgi:hypothetical protein